MTAHLPGLDNPEDPAGEVTMLNPPSVRKFITGDKFIAALLDLGIVNNRTRKVTITAEVGEPIMLVTEEFGDNRLLDLRHGIVFTDNPAEAVAH